MSMNNKRKTLLPVAIIALAGLGGALAIYSGIYSVAADEPHTRPVYALMETVRNRSIAVRAADLQVPADLDDPERIRQGAGNYAAMCMGCHLAPGMERTEMSRGLYPAPPDLSRVHVPAAEAFWVVKHGIKASGMPAWGMSMEDEYIWNMIAFLQKFPELDQEQYAALVASSDGHSHGGGETDAHHHGNHAETPNGKEGGVTNGHDDAMHPDTGSHPHPPGTPPHDDGPASRAQAAVRAHGADGENRADGHEAKPAAGDVKHPHADGPAQSDPAPAPTAADGHEGHDDHHH